jgi:threonine dehydrogenase-like Zn-dependent dehydrogenase
MLVRKIPFTGNEAYNKNLRIQFGRCPVRAIFPEALELLKTRAHLLGWVVFSRINWGFWTDGA